MLREFCSFKWLKQLRYANALLIVIMLLHIWIRQYTFFENFSPAVPVGPSIELNISLYYFPIIGIISAVQNLVMIKKHTGFHPDKGSYRKLKCITIAAKGLTWLCMAIYVWTNPFEYAGYIYPPVNALDFGFVLAPIYASDLMLNLCYGLGKYIREPIGKEKRNNTVEIIKGALSITKGIGWSAVVLYVVANWLMLLDTKRWDEVFHHFGESLFSLFPLGTIRIMELLLCDGLDKS